MEKTPPVPSHGAKSKNFVRAQASLETAIYDGFYNPNRWVPTIAPPIQVFHPVFNSFLRAISDPNLVPHPEVLKSVSHFMDKATSVIPEYAKNTDLRELLSNILNIPLVQELVKEGRSADTVYHVRVENTLVPVLVVENKRSIGEGGCDTLIQAEYSCINMWTLKPDVRSFSLLSPYSQ